MNYLLGFPTPIHPSPVPCSSMDFSLQRACSVALWFAWEMRMLCKKLHQGTMRRCWDTLWTRPGNCWPQLVTQKSLRRKLLEILPKLKPELLRTNELWNYVANKWVTYKTQRLPQTHYTVKARDLKPATFSFRKILFWKLRWAEPNQTKPAKCVLFVCFWIQLFWNYLSAFLNQSSFISTGTKCKFMFHMGHMEKIRSLELEACDPATLINSTLKYLWKLWPTCRSLDKKSEQESKFKTKQLMVCSKTPRSKLY